VGKVLFSLWFLGKATYHNNAYKLSLGISAGFERSHVRFSLGDASFVKDLKPAVSSTYR
jgi:hypothetical protein